MIGISLRSAIKSTGVQGTMDDKLFATLVVTGFMQLAGILMLPEFYGPSYNLLLLPKRIFMNLSFRKSDGESATIVQAPPVTSKGRQQNTSASGGQRKRKKNKKKKA